MFGTFCFPYCDSQANDTDSMENLPGEEKDRKDEEFKQEEEVNEGAELKVPIKNGAPGEGLKFGKKNQLLAPFSFTQPPKSPSDPEKVSISSLMRQSSRSGRFKGGANAKL